MGTTAAKNIAGKPNKKEVKVTELADTYSGEESAWEEIVENSQCCGIKYQKISRKRIIWENNFVDNCKQIADQFEWAKEMIDLVNNCELPKTKYYNEVQQLKKTKQVETPDDINVLKTDEELHNFKKNLKKSAILTYSPTSRFTKQPIGKKIVSSLNPEQRKSRILIQKFVKSRPSQMSNLGTLAIPQRKNEKSISIASNASKNGLRKSIISFVDDTISSVLGNERQISKKTASDLEVFLKFSVILERHLGDINCMLGRIQRVFIFFIEKNYKQPVSASLKIGDLVDNVKQFLVVLRQTIIDYYNLSCFGEQYEAYNPFISNEDNILSACTALLFKDQTFYNILFSAIKQYNKERQSRFNEIISKLQGSQPDKFMIKEKFCLNKKTIQAYLQKLHQQNSQKLLQNITVQDIHIENNQPYKACMNCLSDLPKSKTPINKMKSIMACSQGISLQIQKFYDLNGLQKEKWLLDADQVLSIFCYIIVHAKIQHLHTHLFILDNFATSHQMISMAGYYFSVMNCAIEQLENEYGKGNNEHQL